MQGCTGLPWCTVKMESFRILVAVASVLRSVFFTYLSWSFTAFFGLFVGGFRFSPPLFSLLLGSLRSYRGGAEMHRFALATMPAGAERVTFESICINHNRDVWVIAQRGRAA